MSHFGSEKLNIIKQISLLVPHSGMQLSHCIKEPLYKKLRETIYG